MLGAVSRRIHRVDGRAGLVGRSSGINVLARHRARRPGADGAGNRRAGRLRAGLLTGVLALTSLLGGSMLIEAAVRVWGWSRGIDHRLFLQELTNSDTFALGIWRP